jgi:hypothetical protein
MKKLLLLLGVLLAIPAASRAQSMGTCWGNAIAGSTSTITAAVTPTGGSGHALVAMGNQGTGNTTEVFSDNSGSNIWNHPSAVQANAVAGVWGVDGYVLDPVGGSYTVTLTFGAPSVFSSMEVCELSGLVAPATLDSGATTAGVLTIFNTTFTSSSFTTTSPDLIVMLAAVNSGARTWSVGTIAGVTATLGTGAFDNGREWANVNSPQTGTASMNFGTNQGWVAFTMGFKTNPPPTIYMLVARSFIPPILVALKGAIGFFFYFVMFMAFVSIIISNWHMVKNFFLSIFRVGKRHTNRLLDRNAAEIRKRMNEEKREMARIRK